MIKLFDEQNNEGGRLTFALAGEKDTVALGRELAKDFSAPLVVYLYGELGAGKTTLVRGILQGFGHEGAVKSPTYTLVEPYDLDRMKVFHFDLYRLADPEELEYIGIREYQDQDSILIFEWPDKGAGMIPEADLVIKMNYDGESRVAELTLKQEGNGFFNIQKIRQRLANRL
ncbi:tRNA (adenosine(37)-N6)-threonylcarbamoyltransferase complex ATPase subunit type 1 TsaE [Kangiella sediminilitoris]|uniref:tRNA threonylcarbamoyladenosine biosynthesis protein TsaE n=1 Tax=Kangiella sediminilitoris TaxID=1144748 RepID=A0A1B3BCS7_9GAMM|nr:tRNA (adenosine(37)-N6)-threonylcarbamoyltransferase complex ATPase subunit type 1 TsaE [Kangiella sediminilitoris]AOE50624.1 ATPase [Kangiella sediminilitoris]